jgi:hypothetical protein
VVVTEDSVLQCPKHGLAEIFPIKAEQPYIRLSVGRISVSQSFGPENLAPKMVVAKIGAGIWHPFENFETDGKFRPENLS